MPFDPNSRLKLYMERIIGKPCTEPEIIEVLRLTRQVIEKIQGRSEYPHLSLYCDWVREQWLFWANRQKQIRHVRPALYAEVIPASGDSQMW